MLLEDQRYVQEDLERLEQAVADRMSYEPTSIRDRLNRDHEVAQLLEQIQKQSEELISMYQDADGARSREIQVIGSGDPFEEFYKQLNDIKEHHAKYPNEQAENAETRYRPKRDGPDAQPYMVDMMFSGEEAFGKFFDLHIAHEAFINLPNIKHRSYLQYLEVFDDFRPGFGGIKRSDKLTDHYFKYVGELADYLESFIRRTRPLEDLDKLFATFASEFEDAWSNNKFPGWELEQPGANGSGATHTPSSVEAVWCADCEKEFKNENVHKSHLSGRKHVKAAEQRAKRTEGGEDAANGGHSGGGVNGTDESATRLKERAVAEREYRVQRLAQTMSKEREETKVNVERRQGMTERERQQELENFYNLTNSNGAGQGPQRADEEEDEDDGEEKIYNPLKLPLAWDGKPIPFWLYRLHGLGVEFPCEICGNFVYMGRRAYEKHFNEARHIYGLKCLGISNTALFRDITKIDEALKLWDKMQRDRKRNKADDGSIVQMEDAEGNVMPEKVYYDLQKQGLL